MWPQLPKRFKVNNFLALRRVLSSEYTHSGNIHNPDALRKKISEVWNVREINKLDPNSVKSTPT